MTRWLTISLVFVAAIFCHPIRLVMAAPEMASVSVHVTNNYGEVATQTGDPRTWPRIKLFGSGTVLDLAPDELVTVSYGEYKVVVDWVGFKRSEIVAVVNQPQQVIRVAMRVGTMGGAVKPCSIVGQVTPTVAGVAIRILELFGLVVLDVPIKSDGFFEVQNLECGDYMVMAIAPTGCLGLQFARITNRPGQSPRIQMSLGSEDRSGACGPSNSVR